MIERADAALARATVHFLLQVNRLCVIRLRPGDVGRPEQRNNGPIKCCREVSRSAVRGHEKLRAPYAGLGQSKGNRIIRQGMNVRPASSGRDVP